MKTLICLFLVFAMLFALSSFALARNHGSFGHGGHWGFRGHGGYLYPGPFPGPYYEFYPYYGYPYYNPMPPDCWIPEHFEHNPVTGQDYFVPGHYVRCR